MKTLKIKRANLKEFIYFVLDNNLEFKKCVTDFSFSSIYIGKEAKTYIGWDETADVETLKSTIELINTLLTNCRLEFEEDE